MRAVITVIGKDTVGILAKVSSICSNYNANVTEVTQTVVQDLFAMIMLVDISNMSSPFLSLNDEMSSIAKKLSLSINVMHEDIFSSMHTI